MLANLKNLFNIKSIPVELLRNSAYVSVGQVYQLSLSALLNVLLARTLGIELYGVFVATQAMVGLIYVFARLGVEVPAKREVSRDKSKLGPYFGSALAIRLTFSTPVTLAISLFVAYLLDMSSIPVAALMALFIAATGLVGLLKAAMQALDRFGISAKVTIITQTAYVLAVAVTLWLVPDLITILTVMVIAQLAIFLVNFLVMKSIGVGFGAVWNRNLWRSIIADGLPVMLANSTEYVNLRADTLIVGTVLGATAAGIYGVAYSFYLMLAIVVYLPTLAAFPTLARYSATYGIEAYRRFAGKLSLGILLYALALVGILYVASPLLLQLIYGTKFMASLAPLRVLVFALPFVALNRLMVQVLNASGLQKWTFRASAIGATFNVIVNLALIPRFGLMAAALTTVATEALVWLLALTGFYRASRAAIPNSRETRYGDGLSI